MYSVPLTQYLNAFGRLILSLLRGPETARGLGERGIRDQRHLVTGGILDQRPHIASAARDENCDPARIKHDA